MSTEPKKKHLAGIFEIDFFDCPPFSILTIDDCATVELSAGQFEPMSMKIWCKLARRASCIVDIGANIGFYALAAASLRRDVDIHAFEPNPWAYSRLRLNKRINNFHNIKEHTYALSTESGIARLAWVHRDEHTISTGATFTRTDYSGCDTAPVDVKVFDELGIQLGPQALVKIDVEGVEVSVMRGMTNALKARPDIIIESFNQNHCDIIFDLLKPLGYSAYAIDETAMTVDRLDTLTASTRASKNFNRLLSTNPALEDFLKS